MAALYPNHIVLIHQDNAPYYTANIVQELFDQHVKEFKVSTWPPNFLNLNLVEDLWDVLGCDGQTIPTHGIPTSQLLLMSWCLDTTVDL